MKNRIFITGINGFIGGALKTYISRYHKNVEVFGLARKGSKNKDILVGDMFSKVSLIKMLKEIMPDKIIHLAGGRGNDQEKMYRANFLTTKNLFEAVSLINGYSPRIIIPGTAAEYGNVKTDLKKIREADQARPLSWYGYVKLMQTNLAIYYANQGVDVVIARIFNILGYGTPAHLSMGHFSKEITRMGSSNDKRIIKTKNLDGMRDFLDIEDVCQALVMLSLKGERGEVYNVCSGKAYSIRDLLNKLIKASNLDDIRIQENKDETIKSFDCVGSNVKLKNVCSWRQKVGIDQSLNNTIKYYRETN